MFNKKFMILTIILVSLLAVTAVSAADNATDDVVSIEETADAISVDEADDYVSVEDNQVIEQTENEETISATDDGTFTALQNKINNAKRGSTITLENDYVYDYGFDIEGIYISKSLTINGNGHTLDGNHASRIFCVDDDVVFRDIIFINGKTEYGGAIYDSSFYSSILLENCTFEDNQASCGGAIYINNVGNTVVNCRFSGNSVDHKGGAIHVDDKGECTIENCSFFVNSADYWGGAVYGGSAVNCSFEFNHARYGGGAVTWVSAVNCSFKYNSANEDGGAMQSGSAVNCSFVDNHAGTYGGAMYYVDAVNCVFLGNSANYNGGAMRSGSAVKCTFILNSARNGGALQDTDAENCTLQSNHADEYGGAIYWGSAESCIFRDNTADVEGDDTYKTEFIKPILTVSNFISPYNSGEKLIINFTNSKGIPITNANMTIRVYKNDVLAGTYYCLSGDGWVVDLNVGDYVAVVGIENQVYDVNPVRATLKIVKANTMIDCESISAIYDYNSELVATLTNAATGKTIGGANLIVTLDGVDYALKTNSKGQAKVSLVNLTSGYYNVTASYKGNSKYNPSTTTAEIFIKKSAILTAQDVSVVYQDESGEFVATLTNDEGKALTGANVIVTLDGIDHALKTNSKGQVKVSTADLAIGTYTATVSYKGNAKYNPASTTAAVVVNKKDSIISVVYDNETDELVATLTNAEGKALTSANVKVNINGAEYTLKTNSKGQAVFSMADLPLGKYAVTVSYKGNAKYNPSYATIDIDIKTDVIISDIYDDSNELTATLTNADTGKAVSGANVKVNINGVTTTVKTNSKGKIKVSTADLNVTSYTASISYAGNSKYNAASATTKIDLNKANVVLTADFDANNLELTAVLINSDTGKAVHGANVAVTINGVSTTIKSDSKGQIIMPIDDLDPGTYVAVISYKGNSKYNSISTTVNVVIQ